MLTPKAKLTLDKFLICGCETLLFFPFKYDRVHHTLSPLGGRHLIIFNIHKYLTYVMTFFAGGRLTQAWLRGNFPLLPRILNSVWFMAYILTSVTFIQFKQKEREILQYVNILLAHIFQDEIKMQKYKEEEKSDPENVEDYGTVEPVTMETGTEEEEVLDPHFVRQELKESRKVSYYFIFGMVLLAFNPAVHVKLVQESPCTPHFLISTQYPECASFDEGGIPFLAKVPWMLIELYLVTVIFWMWSFNWAMIFLGIHWMMQGLRKAIYDVTKGKPLEVQTYRQVEAVCIMLNDAFVLYLAIFPSWLFAIVSILMFGIIRIWRTDPGKNIMYPLCGVRCTFEAITPLEAAAILNGLNKRLMLV